MDMSMSIGGIAQRSDLGSKLIGPGFLVGCDRETIMCGTRELASRGNLGRRAKVALVEQGKIVRREESVTALPHANGPEPRIQVRSVKREPSLSLSTSTW